METEDETAKPLAPSMDGAAQAGSKPRARRAPKPLVEGINSPATGTLPETFLSGSRVVPPKVVLTNSEKQLIQEPATVSSPAPSRPQPNPAQLFPQKLILPAKKSAWHAIGWGILLSLLAVSVVLGALFWYDHQSVQDEVPFLSQTPSRTAQNPETSSTTASTTMPNLNIPVSTTTPATSTPAAIPTLAQIKVLTTPTGFLNVRATPSTSAKLLTKIYPGETYPYTKTQSGWYQITLPDGALGWISGQYAQVVR